MRDHTMEPLPTEPEAFSEHIAGLLRELKPDLEVVLASPRELLVDGRRLDLDNVLRMVRGEPDRGSEIVRHYLDQLFAADATTAAEMPFELARSRIMPRVQPVSIFTHLDRELVAHVPFVNGTVVVFVTDLPQMTVSLTTEQILRWGVDIEEVDQIARDNLRSYTPEIEVQFVESKEGGRAAIISEQDGYDAARILLDDLYSRLASHLGGNFHVATPARDMFVAVSEGPPVFIDRVANKVEQDYRRLPYPISPEFFYVTLDGVAGRVDLAA
ncbi:MAG: DUF1444 family protein [Planctomycetota bacterium]